MAPMDAEKKAALLMKLKAGREKTKAARDEAKAKGLPDPKPRKARKSKKLAVDPTAHKAANESIPGIDAPTPASKDVVAQKPVDPTPSKSTPIDVPNLPDEASLKKIVKDAEKKPVRKPKRDIASTGAPTGYGGNKLLREEETGMMAIETMLPGQKESIKEVFKSNKKMKVLAPKSQPEPANAAGGNNATVEDVKKHIPDVKATEGKAPFSFSAIRKTLYQ
jgi:hypothetical protein